MMIATTTAINPILPTADLTNPAPRELVGFSVFQALLLERLGSCEDAKKGQNLDERQFYIFSSSLIEPVKLSPIKVLEILQSR